MKFSLVLKFHIMIEVEGGVLSTVCRLKSIVLKFLPSELNPDQDILIY